MFSLSELQTEEYYTVREFLCALGDDFKKYDLYCWCHPISSFVQSSNFDYFLISDFRFPFEPEQLKKKVNGIEIKTLKLLREGEINNHKSENSLKNYEFDWIIDNRQTTPLETLNEVLKMIQKWEATID